MSTSNISLGMVVARQLRIDSIGFHHVSNHGLFKEEVLSTVVEKDLFLSIVCKACQTYDVTLHTYSIMNNHYHLLLETHRENLSLFMRYINGSYAMHYNKKNKRYGPLWRGRYKSWHLLHEEYMLYTLKYIEYDPIRNDASYFPSDYTHTLSAAILGSAEIPECSKQSIMIEEYNTRRLKEFLESDLSKHEMGLLDDEKRKKITMTKKGIKQSKAKPIEGYFENIDDKKSRNIAMKEAYLDGYTQGEIARLLGVTPALVSHCIRGEAK